MVAQIYQGDKAERSRCAAKRYRENHRDSVSEYGKKYRADHKDDISEKYHQYYLDNHEAMLERARLRRQTHPEDKRRSSRRRKSAIRGSVCELTIDEIQEMMTVCLFCGTTENLTLAHNIPVSRGGKTNKKNTFCLCASCNSRMNTKTLDELMEVGKIVKIQKSYRWA